MNIPTNFNLLTLVGEEKFYELEDAGWLKWHFLFLAAREFDLYKGWEKKNNTSELW